MSINIFVIAICIVCLLVGIFIGSLIFKIHIVRKDKRLIRNAEEVLDGKRSNVIKIDGQEHDATRFKVRDEDDNDTLIDLKGGGNIQNGKTKEDKQKGFKKMSFKSLDFPGEDRPGTRKKKRAIGEDGRRRLRRFG